MNTAVGVRTDVGRVREGNEDSYLAEPPLFAIADGMGGHSAGEVASETAVKVISDGAAQVSSEDPRSLARLLNNANAAIYTKAQSDSALRGMGTTCTLLMAGEGVAHLAHVGDSRAYRLRGGAIEQLTDDHTLVGRMVREGQISPEEAQHHPQRNVITNALGLDSNIAVDLREIEARAGDRLLLCSDGLSSMVSDADIAAAAESAEDPQQAAEALVELALEAGGEDNITVLVIDLGGKDAPAPAPMRTDTSPGHSSPAPSTSRRGRKWLGALLLLVVVVAAAYGAGNWALDNSFYVGVDESDRVTIYQGIPERIAGLTLAEPVEPSTLSLEDLPPSRHALLRQGMKVESLDEAQSTVSDLSDLAREFQDQRAKGGLEGMMQASARRNSELSLLILALILGVGALALVVLARNADILATAAPLMVTLTVAYAVAHIGVRKLAPSSDHLLLPLTALLNALGLAAVYRLDPSGYGPTQATWTMVGVVVFIATLVGVRDYRMLARYKYILGFTGILLLLLPATPLGTEINGARLWLRVGSFSFQPGELAKICLVIFFAAYLAERKELLAIASRRIWRIHFPDIKHFGPLLVMWLLSLAVMFFEKDLGSSLLFFSIFLVMLYIATARVAYMLVGLLVFAGGAYVGYATFSHVQLRVAVWLDVFNPKLISDEGYQLAQSLFALATGGLFGTGLGQGRPDLIPAAHTDFVFAVIGEELGLLGTAAVVVCFMFLVGRGLRIALGARSDFGQLLAAGLIVSFGIQTIIILAGVIRLLPLTGITLPFMSYGGSSLLSNFILMALLARVSHQNASEPDPALTGEILIGGPSVMQAQIRRVAWGLVAAFLLVFAQLNYVQIFAAEDIASNDSNIRSLLAEYSIKRGDIETLDFETVARSRKTQDRFQYLRTYPGGELYGHITGYYSLIYGSDRIEATYSEQLLGESGVISMQDIQDSFLSSGERGDDVRLTVHSQLQQVAAEALGGQEGSVVALDPSSGEVRAMYSNPTYDPGPLSSHDTDEIRSYRRSLQPNSPDSPLLSKATSRSFPPGSTFKVVTAAAALESGRFGPTSTFPDPEALDLPLTDNTLTNFTNTSCTGTGSIDLFTALVQSCDTTFAILGLRLPEELRRTAGALGFNEPLPFDVGTAASTFPDVPDDQEPLRAFAGIGQGDVAATPLQMALVAATVANGGQVPRPQLVREVRDASGSVVEAQRSAPLGRAFSAATAQELTRMMTSVVTEGTGTAAQIDGVEVAGKTGTAQTVEGAAPHAWFICFAPASNPRIAVAVLVENGGELGSEATGGAVAAPIARAVIEADRRIRQW